MKNWSLNQKFALILSLFSASIIGIATYGTLKLKEISANFNEVTDVQMKEVTQYNKLRSTRALIRLAAKDIMLATTPTEIQSYGKEMNAQAELYSKSLAEIVEDASASDQPRVAELQAHFLEFMKIQQKILGYVTAGQEKEARDLSRGPTIEVNKKLGDITNLLLAEHEKSMKDKADESTNTVKKSITIFSVSGISVLIFGLGFAYLVLSATSRKIRKVIDELGENANQVASASEQIATSSTQLSQSTIEQAAALQETTSSVEELRAMTNKNAESARSTDELSTSSERAVENGQRVVAQMSTTMNEISQSNSAIMAQTKESNQRFSEVVQIISEIGSKTKVINDIVFQTKLLSFNASVEAARAGEHGKGFAVVAEEVGNLAQMSGNAAKEISTMLEGSIQKVNSIVAETQSKIESLMNQGREKIESGVEVVHECEKVLAEIRATATEVKTMAGSIASASQEQSSGIEEITKAMNQLDQVTQQNSTVTEEAASSAESLSQQATDLKTIVETLAATVLGSNGGSSERASPRSPHASAKVIALRPEKAKAKTPTQDHPGFKSTG